MTAFSSHVAGALLGAELLGLVGCASSDLVVPVAITAIATPLQQRYGSQPRPKYDGFTPEQRFF